jgi:hypothetical protein
VSRAGIPVCRVTIVIFTPSISPKQSPTLNKSVPGGIVFPLTLIDSLQFWYSSCPVASFVPASASGITLPVVIAPISTAAIHAFMLKSLFGDWRMLSSAMACCHHDQPLWPSMQWLFVGLAMQ